MYRVNDLARVHTYTRGLKAHAANKMRFYGVESVEFQPVAPPLSVTPVELRIPLAEPNPSPAVVHRRSFSIFPSSIFSWKLLPLLQKSEKTERKRRRISGDGDFSGFSASFSFLAILFAVEKRSRAVDGLPSAINKPRGFSVYSHGSG